MAKGDKLPNQGARWLMDLSKAALTDLAYDLAGACSGSADDVAAVNATLAQFAETVCRLRGDRIPKRAAQIREGK